KRAPRMSNKDEEIGGLPYQHIPALEVDILNDRVYEVLRNAIMSGALAQGERLVETQLSEKLGVSRGPLREAIRRLEHDGLVTSIPRRGVTVTVLSRNDVEEIYGLRTALECGAIRIACTKATASDLQELETLVNQMKLASVEDEKVLLV